MCHVGVACHNAMLSLPLASCFTILYIYIHTYIYMYKCNADAIKHDAGAVTVQYLAMIQCVGGRGGGRGFKLEMSFSYSYK